MGWADIAQSRVQAAGIVEAFNVVEHVAAGRGAGQVDPVMNPLGFEGVKETLHRRIVEARAVAAHRRGNPVAGKRQAIGLGSVLAAADALLSVKLQSVLAPL